MNKLGANEEKTWNIYLKPVEDLNDIDGVKPTIAKSTKVPTFEADRYTLAQGEESRITVRSSEAIAANKLVIESPQGDLSELELTENGEGVYTARFEAGDKTEGVYKITVENEAGFLSEMNLITDSILHMLQKNISRMQSGMTRLTRSLKKYIRLCMM